MARTPTPVPANWMGGPRVSCLGVCVWGGLQCIAVRGSAYRVGEETLGRWHLEVSDHVIQVPSPAQLRDAVHTIQCEGSQAAAGEGGPAKREGVGVRVSVFDPTLVTFAFGSGGRFDSPGSRICETGRFVARTLSSQARR